MSHIPPYATAVCGQIQEAITERSNKSRGQETAGDGNCPPLETQCHLVNGSSRYPVLVLPRGKLPIARVDYIPTRERWNEEYNRISLNGMTFVLVPTVPCRNLYAAIKRLEGSHAGAWEPGKISEGRK